MAPRTRGQARDVPTTADSLGARQRKPRAATAVMSAAASTKHHSRQSSRSSAASAASNITVLADEEMNRRPRRSEMTGTTQPTSPSKEKTAERQSGARQDRGNIILLVVLYMLQGVPLGLAMGSMPYLLQKKLTYAQLATFSLASYPYSLKLLWSPLVDSTYFTRVGRRRSWIIPIQLLVGTFLWFLGMGMDSLLEQDPLDIFTLTTVFVLLVFLSATQDIAVDGWALTLLSEENLSYASTSQTIGLNTGYFLSFTVFLALNSANFCNSYIRSEPSEHGLLSLGPYLQFWAMCYFAVTAWLTLFKSEGTEKETVKNMKETYIDIWHIFQLPNVRTFTVILLVSKIGFIANDAVTGFKLMEKGFNEEDLALTVLINFPLQIIFGYYAALWSKEPRRLRPWSLAFWGRLAMAIVAMLVVAHVPADGVNSSYFALVVASSVLSSFLSTVQFVSMGAFFATIADPTIGGTYMTLLNTLSNFGGTYPQYFVLRAVDLLTVAECELPGGSLQDCSTKMLAKECKNLNGTCNIQTDGYYIVSSASVIIAVLLAFFYIMPNVYILERLSPKKWRLSSAKISQSKKR